MTTARASSLSAVTLFAAAGLAAAEPPSYARHVQPFLAKYCLECHSADKAKGGLSLESFAAMQKGGDNGPVIEPGMPDRSRLVRLVEHKDKPAMPPRKARQPKPDEIVVLRAWVAGGARDDTAGRRVTIPDIRPRAPVAAPVGAVAYRPDGKFLAAAGHGETVLVDVASGDVVTRLRGQPGRPTALAFSPDGSRLAVACSQPGAAGELRIYAVPAAGVPADRPEHVLAAHQDAILGLAWAPDGKMLATCGYDRLVKLWDAAPGRELRTLKDHSDSVYAVAFSPDGRLLASGAADRAVKVWDPATGVRLYTLGEPTDWVYAVAWSPDGRRLAAAGVDKSIRVWEATAAGGRIVESVFAHDGPVVRLAYAADGRTLYSLGEDRVVKAWDTARMVERKVYPAAPEAVLALAVRPDHRQLALGRYDGVLALLEEATGKVQAEPLPARPKPPVLARLHPAEGRRGQALRITFEGDRLDQPLSLTAEHAAVTARFLERTRTRAVAEVIFPATTPAGRYPLVVRSPAGRSGALPFTVDLFAASAEKEPNDSPAASQPVTLPVTVVGALDRIGDVDFYRFEARAGQQVGVQAVTAAVGSKVEPVLVLTDAAGTTLAETTDGFLGYTCPRAGRYTVGIRDREYRGGMHYRLHIGDVPVVTAVYPLGLQRGTQALVRLAGVNLGPEPAVRVNAPADAALGSRLPLPVASPYGPPLGNPTVVVGEFPEVASPGAAAAAGETVPVPGTANGRLGTPGAVETWRFQAMKGQTLVVETNARRLGSPLDSTIEILDAAGRPVPRAVLRCLAKTYIVFRDHESSTPALRLEAWAELAMNDYVLVGEELLKIDELPKGPDDNCTFFSVGGRRVGLLGTTPTQHSIGTPVYKVSVHPPGTQFPPNGLPTVTLYYRNDDGGPHYDKDSALFFDPPADGTYQVRVTDARGQGGPAYGYRLTVRPPRPDFKVSFGPPAPAVWRGGAVPVTVTAERFDGFDGPIDVRLDRLPPGLHAPATTIPAGEYSTSFALSADPKAAPAPKAAPTQLIARARIDGREVVRTVAGGVPTPVDPGDIVATTDQSAVTVRPGGIVRMTAHIERRHGFAGRVPVEVKGLPHGVRVLNIGLNGILITEKESSRTFVIYCEPWVRPMEHPFVVLAKSESKGTEHAAPSVMLRVAGP